MKAYKWAGVYHWISRLFIPTEFKTVWYIINNTFSDNTTYVWMEFISTYEYQSLIVPKIYKNIRENVWLSLANFGLQRFMQNMLSNKINKIWLMNHISILWLLIWSIWNSYYTAYKMIQIKCSGITRDVNEMWYFRSMFLVSYAVNGSYLRWRNQTIILVEKIQYWYLTPE